jgi:hypothetical protein
MYEDVWFTNGSGIPAFWFQRVKARNSKRKRGDGWPGREQCRTENSIRFIKLGRIVSSVKFLSNIHQFLLK